MGLHGINSVVLSGYLPQLPIQVEEGLVTFPLAHRLVAGEPPVTIVILVEGYRAVWAVETLHRGAQVVVQGALVPWARGTIALRGDWIETVMG